MCQCESRKAPELGSACPVPSPEFKLLTQREGEEAGLSGARQIDFQSPVSGLAVGWTKKTTQGSIYFDSQLEGVVMSGKSEQHGSEAASHTHSISSCTHSV